MNMGIKTKLLPFLASAIIAGAFLTGGVYAAEDVTDMPELSVDKAWLSGDMLSIAVTDKDTGETQKFELNLREYAKSGDEYVTVQATDKGGRTSNAIQFKNPYYESQSDKSGSDENVTETDSGTTESTVSGNPFTPDGTGTVLDNVTVGAGVSGENRNEENSKEFFTVETANGNVFYLIVDRDRNTDNVYLLNTVTEDDLMSLTGKTAGADESAISEPKPVVSEPAEPETPPAEAKKESNTGMLIFIIIAAVGVGGAGYYFKILRPKQLGTSDADDYDDGEDFDDYEEVEVDYNDDSEEVEDE